MRIARIETFAVPPRWVFCRVETDDGLVGWGEPVVEGRAEAVRGAVQALSELLIGTDPRQIERSWQRITKGGFYRGGPILSSAVAGLDQALWDILGKSLGVPVHVLLGGAVRDRVRVYGWIGGDDPAQAADAALEQVEAGLTAVKMNATGRWDPMESGSSVDAVVARAETVRDATGQDFGIGLDFHGRVGPADAKRLLRALEPIGPMFVEEPVLPELGAHLPALAAGTTIPLATGERLYDRLSFKAPLEAGIAVAQPDLSHAGGISESRRIAALAEMYGALFAPHCPLGPIALAACLQVDFATPNFFIQEQSIGMHYNDGGVQLLDYVMDTTPFQFRQGYIERWDAPGLGVQIDEDAVRAADARSHTWRNPVWEHPDGSFAEW